jgi:hypothetical protein
VNCDDRSVDWLHEALTSSRLISSSRERTLLHVGFRLSYVAVLLTILLGASSLYDGVAIGAMLACFFADWPLYRRDKRRGLVTKRRSRFDPPADGWPNESTIQRLRRRRASRSDDPEGPPPPA